MQCSEYMPYVLIVFMFILISQRSLAQVITNLLHLALFGCIIVRILQERFQICVLLITVGFERTPVKWSNEENCHLTEKILYKLTKEHSKIISNKKNTKWMNGRLKHFCEGEGMGGIYRHIKNVSHLMDQYPY